MPEIKLKWRICSPKPPSVVVIVLNKAPRYTVSAAPEPWITNSHGEKRLEYHRRQRHVEVASISRWIARFRIDVQPWRCSRPESPMTACPLAIVRQPLC